ncbi:MAG: HEAT repeat domain-containing protein [Methylococcales bacterium]
MTNHSSNITPSLENQWIEDIPDDEHLNDEQFEEYVLRLLSPEDVEGIDKHLAVCPECKQEMQRSRDLVSEWVQSDLRQSLLAKVQASCDAEASTALTSEVSDKSATLAVLLRRLTDQDPEIRLRAAQALGNTQPEEWIPDLFPLLRIPLSDNNRDVRVEMIHSIGMLGHIAACPEIIECLINCLCDADRTIRYAAATTVRRFGAAAATPAVLSFLPLAIDNADSDSQLDAFRMLCTQFRGAAATTGVVQALIMKVNGNRPELRTAAIYVIGTLGPKAATSEVLAVLAAALMNTERDARAAAAEALSELGSAGVGAVVTALRTAVQDGEWEVRSAAAKAIGAIGSADATPDILEELVNLLADPNLAVRKSAAQALGISSTQANQLVVREALIRAQSDPDEGVRMAVRDALAKFDRKIIDGAPPDKIAIIIFKFACGSLPILLPKKGNAKAKLVCQNSDGTAQVRIRDTGNGDLDVIVTSINPNDFGKPVTLSIANWSDELTFERRLSNTVLARTTIQTNIWKNWPTDQDLVIEIP